MRPASFDPSAGSRIAFETWAGTLEPAFDDEGFGSHSEHASIGLHAGPMIGARAFSPV